MAGFIIVLVLIGVAFYYFLHPERGKAAKAYLQEKTQGWKKVFAPKRKTKEDSKEGSLQPKEGSSVQKQTAAEPKDGSSSTVTGQMGGQASQALASAAGPAAAGEAPGGLGAAAAAAPSGIGRPRAPAKRKRPPPPSTGGALLNRSQSSAPAAPLAEGASQAVVVPVEEQGGTWGGSSEGGGGAQRSSYRPPASVMRLDQLRDHQQRQPPTQFYGGLFSRNPMHGSFGPEAARGAALREAVPVDRHQETSLRAPLPHTRVGRRDGGWLVVDRPTVVPPHQATEGSAAAAAAAAATATQRVPFSPSSPSPKPGWVVSQRLALQQEAQEKSRRSGASSSEAPHAFLLTNDGIFSRVAQSGGSTLQRQ